MSIFLSASVKFDKYKKVWNTIMPNNFSAYNIILTNQNSGVDLAAPSDGFVDPNTLEQYGESLESTPSGLTFALSEAKRRANIRWGQVILQMNLITNCYIEPNSIVVSGGTYNAPPVSVSFQVIVEHGDSSLYTADELNAGSYLTGTVALSRMICRGLQYVQTPSGSFGDPIANVFDPTSSDTFGTPGSTTSAPRTGERMIGLSVGSLASSLTAAAGIVSITQSTTTARQNAGQVYTYLAPGTN